MNESECRLSNDVLAQFSTRSLDSVTGEKAVGLSVFPPTGDTPGD